MKRFALFLIFLFVLSAVPVKAQTTSYYMLSFDGDDYVIVDDADDMLAPDTLTVVVWVKDYRYDPNLGLIAKGNPNGTDPPYSWFFGYYAGHSDALGLLVRSNGSTYLAGFRVSSFDGMLAGVADGSQLKVYANGALMATGSYPGTIDKHNFPLLIGMIYNIYWVNVDVHGVMIYNRALSDTEIQNLYNDPNNPPLDGLKLWYAPDSVDVINGVWKDKSGNGNDGTLVRATAERVSIPKLYVYDAITLNPIPYLDVSVTLIANNTTTGLIPSMPVLPYNETVTLNVSATNYESRILSTWSGVELISVYLEPVPNGTTSTVPIQPTTTPTFAPIELQNDFGFLGAQQGAKFVAGKWSEAFNEFWTISPMYSLILPVLFTLGLIFAGYMVSRNPLVPIGITAVTATFFGLIDVPLSISIVSPLAAFVLFLVVWALWDFYKHYERS